MENKIKEILFAKNLYQYGEVLEKARERGWTLIWENYFFYAIGENNVKIYQK